MKPTLVLRACLWLAFVSSQASTWAADAPGKPQQLPTTTLGISFYSIKAELAQTERQREIGLMHRTAMGANDGMIFVFERAGTQCFWMKNTLLPLTAAFVADDGTIVNLADMKPQTTDSHCSEKPVRFVLEMHQGWFTKKGLNAGSRLRGVVFKP